MNAYNGIAILTYLLTGIVIAPLMGVMIYYLITPGKTASFRDSIESMFMKLAGCKPVSMTTIQYMYALLVFHMAGFVFLTLLLTFQGHLPLNPANIVDMPLDLAVNTSISFITNTNWQAYSGESALTYLSQMIGLTVQNFLSAASGIAVLLVMARAFTSTEKEQPGNFWLDLFRITVYILLPVSLLLAIVLMHEGVVQSFLPYVHLSGFEADQVIPLGPAASQISIKQLGTNGGGFFGLNSSHPFENPTVLSNFLQSLSLLFIPAALVFTFGLMVKSMKHALSLFFVMGGVFVTGLLLSFYFESQLNPVTGLMNLEGKEMRHGIVSSVIWSTATTVASNGSVNAMHDSLSPITGMIALLNMMFGEIIFGGVGSGLYGMILYVILTVFLSGLMVGRSPEYLGKKIEAYEVTLALTGILLPSFLILIFSSIAVLLPQGLVGLNNHGPHGLTEILYTFTSAAGNNGSAFSGLNANSLFYNSLTGLTMLIGRFGVIIPVLLIARSLFLKKTTPPSAGTFPVYGVMFSLLLTGVISITGALTFFPVLSLGPVAEYYLQLHGIVF